MFSEKEMRTVLERHDELVTEASKIEAELIDQFDITLKAIYDALGYTIDCWYVSGAEEGEVGDLGDIFVRSDLDKKTIDITRLTIETDHGHLSNANSAIIIDDEEHWMSEVILTKWLFMQRDDIVEDVKRGRAAYVRKEEKEKEKKEKKRMKLKENERKLLDAIESKLSSEEKKILERKIK